MNDIFQLLAKALTTKQIFDRSEIKKLLMTRNSWTSLNRKIKSQGLLLRKSWEKVDHSHSQIYVMEKC